MSYTRDTKIHFLRTSRGIASLEDFISHCKLTNLVFCSHVVSDDDDREGDTRLLTGEELVELLLSVSPVQDGGLTTVGMVGGWIIMSCYKYTCVQK